MGNRLYTTQISARLCVWGGGGGSNSSCCYCISIAPCTSTSSSCPARMSCTRTHPSTQLQAVRNCRGDNEAKQWHGSRMRATVYLDTISCSVTITAVTASLNSWSTWMGSRVDALPHRTAPSQPQVHRARPVGRQA